MCFMLISPRQSVHIPLFLCYVSLPTDMILQSESSTHIPWQGKRRFRLYREQDVYVVL